MNSIYLLFWSIQIVFFGFLVLVNLIPNHRTLYIKQLALIVTYTYFFIVAGVGLLFIYSDSLATNFVFQLSWIQNLSFGLSYTVLLDSFAFVFMLLTTLLFPLCVASSWNNIRYNIKEFVLVVLTVEWMLLNMFLVSDLLLFYIWFEAILIPMYFLIGVWGSRQRKTYASFMFFFYTFVGSLFMLFGLFTLYSHYSTLYVFSLVGISSNTVSGFFLWPLFMLAFAVKVPMFPTHIWLPEAHVEAPTVGSVLLAGVLLKLGVFAILRFLIPMFPLETQYYAPVITVFALLGILYVSFTTIRQIDLKKIIAYASVAHMNYVVLGIIGTNVLSISGAIFLMVGHGIVSAGLFFMIGFLYDRYKTRNIRYYRGLVAFMPIYAVSFFIFSLANMSFPGTCNFIGESVILLGVSTTNVLVAFLAAVGIIFCAIYTIWLFNRIMYGSITPNIITFADLTYKEFSILFPLLVLTIFLGLCPSYLFSILSQYTYVWLENYSI